MFEQSAPTPDDGADHGASDGTERGTTASGPGRTNRSHGGRARVGRAATRVALAGER
jgi:hypothetical protein